MEKKKVLTAVAVGAATMAAGVGANQAKADSVKVTKQVIGDETKVTTTTTKTVDSQEQMEELIFQMTRQSLRARVKLFRIFLTYRIRLLVLSRRFRTTKIRLIV